MNKCWILPNGQTIEVPSAYIHEDIARDYLTKNMPKELKDAELYGIVEYCINNFNWIRVSGYNNYDCTFQLKDLESSNINRANSFIQNNIAQFNQYREYSITDEPNSQQYFLFSNDEMAEANFNFQIAINKKKQRARFMHAQMMNILKIGKQQLIKLKRIFN